MTVQQMLGLSKPAIAVGFFDAPPEGVPAWNSGAVPAGCSFWKEAMQGRSFFTVPADHFNCAVGSYTHAISLPPERAKELEQTVGFMVGHGYIEMAEVPGIPVLSKPPAYIAYGPVEGAPFRADAVVVAARPAQAMLLYEAGVRAGAAKEPMQALGRPGCAVLPLALNTGSAALSFGCKGNRFFTGLPDEELYLSFPAEKWPAVLDALETITRANEAVGGMYEERARRVAGNA